MLALNRQPPSANLAPSEILEVHARRDSKCARRFGRELLTVGDGL
jgi:hypothetical protein